MDASNYILVTAEGKIIPCASFDVGVVESKNHGICKLYSLNLVEVFNANKALWVNELPKKKLTK